MDTPLILTMRDKDGRIGNTINYPEFLENKGFEKEPDVYLSFLLKTIIDDFGDMLVRGSEGKINKEQFEANFIHNLTDFLSIKTRV